MKIRKIISVLGLALGLSVIGQEVDILDAPISYAAEFENPELKANQRHQLERAVDDVINVVNSDVYYNYTSQELKAKYEQAVENARLVLAKGEAATLDELKDATIRINTVKNEIYNETLTFVQNQKKKKTLEAALNKNRMQAQVARMLLNEFPKTVKNVRGQLEALLERSDNLAARAEKMLAEM